MKTALITGASGGIGISVCEKFVTQGYFVVAQYNTNKQALDDLCVKLEENGFSGYLYPLQADFEKSEDVERFFKIAKKSFSHFDVLVNNAGVDLYKLITDTTDEDFIRVFDVNVKSAYMLSKLCLTDMISRKYGKIVNVSSVWGDCGGSMESAYSASKAALIGLTKSLAKEVGLSGINVNCVCPGVINTKMNSRFTKAEIRELAEYTPLQRLGEPGEVANLIYFLSSDDSAFITGQVITIDGGFTL